PGSRIVCTVTGNGLKDPEWAIAGAPKPVQIQPKVDQAAEALGLI
ncbi:MAG: threonine synthase, partial [Frankiaceae bacterium]|nr:threonine synthase [Frankiaceae bacterium]